jgi:hypothetical protein
VSSIEYTSPCPYCGAPCECDLADVGVGFVQCGPYHCEACEAYEAGPYDDKAEDKARIDQKTGWFPPKSAPGSSANMIGGRLATVEETRVAYHARFAGNPDYHEPGAVDAWFAEQREPSP